MPVKALLALMAAPFLSSASLPESIMFVNHPAVVQVRCDRSLGTAFRIGEKAYASVHHVTDNTGCKVNGQAITVTYSDAYRDFSVFRVENASGDIVRINCEGFQPGQVYQAVGYAYGHPVQRLVAGRYSPVASEAFNWNWMAVLVGAEHFIPGMSGGIVADSDGAVVGLVNGFNPYASLSFSRPLKETPLCR